MAVDRPQGRPRTPRRVWVFGLLFLVAGGLIIWAGRCIDGIGGYDRSIFINSGVAIGLIGPLYVGQQLLSARISEARDRAVGAESAARATEQALEDQSRVEVLGRQG